MEQNAWEGVKALTICQKARIIRITIICGHSVCVLFGLNFGHLCYFSLCFLKIVVTSHRHQVVWSF
jgi:hypothetical protein